MTAAAAAMLITACGSSSGGAGNDLSAGLKGTPIRVEMIYDGGIGGGGSADQPEGARAAVKAINEAGGIKGRPLALIVCNTRANPNAAADCGRTAVRQGVIALVGSASQFAARYAPLLERHKIPNLGALPSGPADFISKSVFPIQSGPTLDIVALSRFLADEGARRIATARPDLPAAAVTSQLVDAALAPLHLKLVADVGVPTSAPDMSPYVQQVLAGHADGVVVLLLQQPSVQFIHQLRQTNPSIKIALQTTEPGPVAKALGTDARGILEATSLVPPTVASPATRSFASEMKAAGYSDLSGFRANSWLSVHVFADLVRRLPSITSAALWDALKTTRGLKTGLTPPLQWVRGGAAGAVRTFNACSMAVTLDSQGAPRPVTGKFFDPYHNRACPSP